MPPDPDIPLREVISPAHELVIWLSLDSLNPYWLTLPPVAPDPAPIRAAAQAGLHGWHASSGTDAPESWFLASLAANGPVGAEAAMRSFIGAILRVQTSTNLGLWKSWVSQNQHRPHVPGMDPAAANTLMKIYHDEVIAKPDAIRAEITAQIKATPLSDWDLAIHANYGYCTEETDRFPESMLLSGLWGLMSALQFNSFLARHVLALPAADQACLLAAVQAAWADLWSDQEDQGMILPGPRHTAADALLIPAAAQVVVWS